MTLLGDIATRLGTLSGGALSGYTVLTGFRPDYPDKIVVIYETGGRGASLGFGVAGIQFEYPSIQVLARGEADDYAGPRAVLEAVYQDLPKVQATTLNSTTYHTIIALQAPFLLERDPKRRVVLVVNFNIEKRPA